MYDLLGVGIKGDDHGFLFYFGSIGHYFSEDFPVAQVHPVEVTYCNNRTGQISWKNVEISYNIHVAFHKVKETTTATQRSSKAGMALFSRGISLDNLGVHQYKRL